MTATNDYREEIRATLRGMTDEAVAYQQIHGSPGGIDREEIESEAALRRDPMRLDLIGEVGRFCPCGLDLWHVGCYRCLKARGAVWTCGPEVEAAFHGRPNPYI